MIPSRLTSVQKGIVTLLKDAKRSAPKSVPEDDVLPVGDKCRREQLAHAARFNRELWDANAELRAENARLRAEVESERAARVRIALLGKTALRLDDEADVARTRVCIARAGLEREAFERLGDVEERKVMAFARLRAECDPVVPDTAA